MISYPPRRPTVKKPMILAIIAACLFGGIYAIFFSGNGRGTDAPQMQTMPVEVETITLEKFRLWNDYSARLSAVNHVEIRPQVGGAITEIHFTEGAHVKAGDMLFTIDPRPYEAAVAQAQAELNSARAQAKLTRVEFDRAQALIKKQYLSKSAFDSRQSSNKVALSAIEAAEANLAKARLNLDYAHIKSPIDGKVGRAELTLGNLVQAGANAPLLTTVVADGEIYAEFDVDEQTYLKSVRMQNNSGENMPVKLIIPGDAAADEGAYSGHIHSFDNQLDSTSGTIRARAIFSNSDAALIPGMYVTVRLGSNAEVEGILVSEQAIGIDQSKRFVYVVDADNKTEYREVTLGGLVAGERVVLSGLKAGDKVVQKGLQRLRPATPVIPKEVE